jgi:hypothetical protein
LKVAQLGAAWDSLKSAAGQFVVQALIPMISALTTIVTFAFNAVQALALLFGMQIELGDSSGFGSAAGDANDLATGLGKAAKNAQKLLSFDEVFTLKDTSGGGGGGGGGGKIGNPKVTPVPEFDFSNSVFKKIADWYATSNLKKIVDDIKEGWTWIQTNILKPAESYSGKALLLFLDDLDKGLGLIHTVWTIIKPDVEKLWEKFLRPIANYMAEKGLKTLRDIGDRLTALSDWCKNNPEKVRLAFIVLTVAFGLLVSPILIVTSSIAGWLSIMGKLVANMKNITKILLDLATGDWKQAWTDYKEALDNFGSAGRLAKDAVQLLGDTMVYVSGILTDLAKGDWKSAWEKLTSFPEHFRDVFNSLPSIPKFIDNMMHPLRTLEDILTRIIDKINKIGGAKITVPDIGTGGGCGGTHAATGAVVLRPTSMVLGDNGGAGELAMPLGNSPQVADFANRVAKAVAGSGQSQSLDVRIVMDGRTVARKVIGPLDKETLARGTPIMVEVV